MSSRRPSLAELRDRLTAQADTSRVASMTAYMKGHFAFLGVMATPRRTAATPWIRAFKDEPVDAIVQVAQALWNEPEREFQYVGADLLRRYQRRLMPHHLHPLKALVENKAWWDTVDALAAHPIGTCVQAHGLQDEMDAWSASKHMWVARTALLHQLTYGERTDTARLFRYATSLADHPDFFIKKAIGWALRELYRTQPDAVVDFVHGVPLSALSRREALKHHRR